MLAAQPFQHVAEMALLTVPLAQHEHRRYTLPRQHCSSSQVWSSRCRGACKMRSSTPGMRGSMASRLEQIKNITGPLDG